MLFITIFLTSLLIVSFFIPVVVNLAIKKRLFDDPSESRKIHKRIIPNLGGIAIFSGFLFSCAFFISPALLGQGSLLMAGGLILFMVGLKDDLIGLSPLIKFIAQFLTALIISGMADIRIKNLNDIFGLGELNYYVSLVLTVIIIVGIVNAFNLIDGIDGLAASLGIMVSLVYAFLFFQAGELGWSYLSIALTGALIGFLFFNVSPARIFMGDSGSLVLGFIAIVLSIKFLNVAEAKPIMFGLIPITSAMGLVTAILIIPVFDTLRVFTLRILKNKSPFLADANHLHHRLLSLGLSHMQTTLILTMINVLFVVMAISMQNLGNFKLITLLAATVICSNWVFSAYADRYKKAMLARSFIGLADKEKSFGAKILESISEN